MCVATLAFLQGRGTDGHAPRSLSLRLVVVAQSPSRAGVPSSARLWVSRQLVHGPKHAFLCRPGFPSQSPGLSSAACVPGLDLTGGGMPLLGSPGELQLGTGKNSQGLSCPWLPGPCCCWPGPARGWGRGILQHPLLPAHQLLGCRISRLSPVLFLEGTKVSCGLALQTRVWTLWPLDSPALRRTVCAHQWTHQRSERRREWMRQARRGLCASFLRSDLGSGVRTENQLSCTLGGVGRDTVVTEWD